MKSLTLILVILSVGCAVTTALPAVQEVEKAVGSERVTVELDLKVVLRQILQWMRENDIKISDIFSSEFFNSDFFNSDFFNSDYFNSDFFNSELFNSEIFNRVNFLKLTNALFALDGISNEGTFQPEVARVLVGFFETKDWQGLSNYLMSLP